MVMGRPTLYTPELAAKVMAKENKDLDGMLDELLRNLQMGKG